MAARAYSKVGDRENAAVYVRGAMTLQALRNKVGDNAFFRILRRWAATKSGGNGQTEEFMALAESISGKQLDHLFKVWLFTGEKPPASPSRYAIAVPIS